MSKIKSNVETEKEIEPLFDYGDITERDKSVIEEVISLFKSRPGIPSDMVIEELKQKFQLVDIPMMKLEDSVWYQLTKDERIGAAIQGYRQTVDDEGNKIKIPHVGFSADLDFLDEFVNRLAIKVASIPKEEDK